MVTLKDLTEPQRAVLDAIVRGGPGTGKPMACVELDWLETQGCTAVTIDELVAMRLVVRWDQCALGRPLTPKVTLDPFASAIMGVHILERTTIVGEELSEDPYWAETSQEPRSIHLPKRRHEIRWPWMDEIEDPDWVDPSEEPEFLVDEMSGEEIELFTQLDDGREVSGIKITIDHRLKGAKGKGGAKTTKRRKAG